jgi:WD40 repeat protein
VRTFDAYNARSFSISPDGQSLLIGFFDGAAERRSLTTGEVEKVFGYQPNVTALAVSGDKVIAGYESRMVRIWPVGGGQPLRELMATGGRIDDAAAGGTGNYAAIVAGGQLQWLSLETGELRKVEGAKGVDSVDFSPDGRQIALGSLAAISLLPAEADSVENMRTLVTDVPEADLFGSGLRALDFSPDGGLLLSNLGDDSIARILDVPRGKVMEQFEGHSARINAVAFSPSGNTVATVAADGTARVWSSATGRIVHSLPAGDSYLSATDVAYSPDGSMIATAADDGFAVVWSVDLGVQILSITVEGVDPLVVEFTPNGRGLVVGWSDSITRVYPLLDPTTAMEQAREIAASLPPLTPEEECEFLIATEGCVALGVN